MTTLQKFQARVIALSNVDISITGVGVAVNGVTLADTNKAVLNGQTDPTQNGYWVVNAGGAWTRDPAFDTAAEMLKGTEFYITEGDTDNAGSTWTFNTGATITVGVTSLSFKRETYGPGAAIADADTIERDNLTNQWKMKNIFTPTGYYTRVQTDVYGRVTDTLLSETETTFIEGLKLVYDGPAAFTVEAGGVYIPGEGAVIEGEETSISGLALTASTWYSIYGLETGGVLTFETVTQGPESTPYLGNARIKGPDGTPDDTRRLLGERRVSGTANTFWPWSKYGDLVTYDTDIGAGTVFRVLSDGRATAYTPVDCSAVVPSTSRRALARFYQRSSQAGDLSRSDFTGSNFTIQATIDTWVMPITLDANRAFQYKFGSAPSVGNGLVVDVMGFYEELR